MSTYNYSYNVLINRLEAFAAGHFLIRRFTHGQIDLADQLQDDQYPFMHVVPDQIKPVDGGMQFDFMVMFADIPRDKEYKAEYQREVISDCIRLGQDLIAEVKNGLQLFGFDVQLVNNPTFEPFMEEQKNTVTGVTFTLSLEVPWDWSACDIPAIWSVGGDSTGGTGTGYGITLQTNGVNNVVQNLLNLEAGTNITITDNGNGTITIDSTGGGGASTPYVSTEWNANHTTATGNQYVIGDRVWYNGNVYACIANNDGIIPTNASYWTLQSIGYRLRQTPVDWNASSGDYQILNKPTLATVATTGDYNDLSNLPTIPAAQIQSDWNQANSAALDFIKNKPTIPGAQGLQDVITVDAVLTSNNNITFGSNNLGFSGQTGNLNNFLNFSGGNAAIGASTVIASPSSNTGAAARFDGLVGFFEGYDINTGSYVAVRVDADNNQLQLVTPNVNLNNATNGQVLTLVNNGTGAVEFTTISGGSGTVTSVAVSVPSPTNAALSVSGSPILTSGTIAIGANGTVDQYIDGTGALRTFPSTGGGGGQIFYFNGNVSQGTIGGNSYYQLGVAANTGPAANFTRATTGVIARFITDISSPNHTIIPAGVWTIDVYLSETGGGSNHAQILAKLYTYNGSTFTLIATSTMEEITNGSVPDLYSFTISVPTTVTSASDRVHIEFDIQNTNGKTVTLYTEDGKIGEVHTTYAIGLSSLNGLTASTQNFATGTTGTDFAINSAGSTHTFNLPTASAANRGALSSADWSTFNGKQDALVSGTNIKTINSNSLLGSGNVSVGTVTSVGGTGTVAGISLSGTVTGSGNLTLGGTLAVPIGNITATGTPSATTFLRGDGSWSSASLVSTTIFASQITVTQGAGSTAYWPITGSNIPNVTENLRVLAMPVSGTIKNLFVRIGAAQSATGSLVFTVRKNAVNQAVTVTFTNADGSNVTKSDTTNSFSVVAGDLITIQGVNNAPSSASATVISISLVLER